MSGSSGLTPPECIHTLCLHLIGGVIGRYKGEFMFKVLGFVFVALVSSVGFASERSSCVIQVLKNDTNGQQAHFILACGSETIATHNVTPMEQLTADEIIRLKNGYLQALKSVIGSDVPVTCFESDTELFWIGICHK